MGGYELDRRITGEIMFQKGQKVEALVDLMSDDRANGQDDGTPTVPKGTIGTVLEKSSDGEGCTLKDDSCWVVDWGVIKFDTAPEEVKIVP